MQASIIKKLEQIEERHNEVSALLADAETISDQDKYRNLSKEYAQLTPVVDTFKAWRQVQGELKSAQEMLRDPDPDMKRMAEEELEQTSNIFTPSIWEVHRDPARADVVVVHP